MAFVDHISEVIGRSAELLKRPKTGSNSDFEDEHPIFVGVTVLWITARGLDLGFEFCWRMEIRIPKNIRKKITVKIVTVLRLLFLSIPILYTLSDISSSESGSKGATDGRRMGQSKNYTGSN